MHRSDDPELNLALTAMGIPSWLDYFQRFNSLQSWVMAVLALLFSYSLSFWGGVGYFIGYSLLRAMIMGAGATVAQNTDGPGAFIAAVIIATFVLLGLNIACATYLLGLWGLPQ